MTGYQFKVLTYVASDDANWLLILGLTFGGVVAPWGLVRLLRELKLEKDALWVLAVASIVLFALGVRYGFTIWHFLAK